MIKCSKCNTLYSESAKICLYCKIPLEASTTYDEKFFTFKLKEFTSESEAQSFKTSLLASEIPCYVKKENEKFIVLIPEDAKKNAFKPNPTTILEDYGSKDKRVNKNKVTIYIALLFVFIIVCFLFFSTKSGKQLFVEDKTVEYKVVPEGGTVDPRIMDVKSTNSQPKKKKKEIKEKEGKDKVENPTPH